MPIVEDTMEGISTAAINELNKADRKRCVRDDWCVLGYGHNGTCKRERPPMENRKTQWPLSGDDVDRPPHYTTGDIETWDFLVDKFGTSWMAAAAIQYLVRYRYKNGIADLRKAKAYIDKLIGELDGKGGW